MAKFTSPRQLCKGKKSNFVNKPYQEINHHTVLFLFIKVVVFLNVMGSNLAQKSFNEIL